MLARQIAKAATDKKGIDVSILDLRSLTSMADYFVIASGQATVHVQAIVNHIDGSLRKKDKTRPFSIEGHTHGHWVLMDYGSVVAHIFYEEERDFYRLDKLWEDAKKVSLK